MNMNRLSPALYNLLAREQKILMRADSVTTWECLSSVDAVHFERATQHRLRQEFAHAVADAMAVTTDDELNTCGRTYRTEAYVLPRNTMNRLLLDAYSLGWKDAI